jgi:hypothetical protein
VSVLELNPRFGGGYPFSHAAGANLPAALVAWALGDVPAASWLTVRSDVASAKCDRLVRIATRSVVSDVGASAARDAPPLAPPASAPLS